MAIIRYTDTPLLDFESASPTHGEGRLFYDADEHALSYYNEISGISHQIGQEGWVRIYNNSGSTISNGIPVYVSGSESTEYRPTIGAAQANAVSTSRLIGVATHEIPDASYGYVTQFGLIHDIDTSAFTDGAPVWLSATTPGAYTTSEPQSPNLSVFIGYVLRSDLTSGVLFVTTIGNTTGASGEATELTIPVRKGSAGTINRGQPVYISGYNVGQQVIEVELASASSSVTMPALGLAGDTITNASNSFVVASGRLSGINTSSYTLKDGLYVSTSAGVLTNSRPTGSALIQRIATVTRVNASTGVLTVVGAGRTNDVPNLAENNFWLGDSNSIAQATDFDTAVAANSAVTANTAKVTNANHTGDVTGSGALTIADNAVTNAKAADMAQSTIKGRITASTGDPEDLSATQVRTILNVEDGATANSSDATLLDRSNHTGVEFIDGSTDAIQLRAQGHTSQTNPILQIENSGASSVFSVDNSGNVTLSGTVDGRDLAADGSKLDLIESGADITDTANVDAAGATMNADTDVSANGWVVDEDDFASNDATKVPTQQSVKAYVDSSIASQVTYQGGYNAATNTPDLDTSPSGVSTGYMYTVTTAGNFFTIGVEIGDVLIAEQDDPSLESHWTVVNKNLDAASIKTAYESNSNTNAYTDADQTKVGHITITQAVDLDTLESDVTTNNSKISATTANVDSAGATMNTDSTLVGNGYFLDEDNMASNDATKVASQQSIKAYVDTASTADRSRTNHTGTQLANTISDFAATVRSTVLTGLSLASAIAITASDTVLSALGKLQAQINALTKVGVYRTVYIPAASMVARETNGAEAVIAELATNDIGVQYYAFDSATEEGVNASFSLPDEWDKGTIKVKFYWDSAASGSGNVTWGVAGMARKDNEVLDSSFSETEQTTVETITTVGDLHVSSPTSAITIASSSTIANDDLTTLRIVRKTGGSSVDAFLYGIKVQYKEGTIEPALWS